MRNKLFFIVVIGLALVVRIYRLDQLLGFFYDQGRDAKIIWDLWHHGRFFLIGPTTGIEGIFRGPWYYWLIAPWYLLGKGNPVWPAVFLGAISALAIWWGYRLAAKIAGVRAGLIFAILASLSYFLILASRWLSNPTPMLLISMFMVQCIFWVTEGKKWAWLGMGVAYGLAMQFGSAAELFYLPVMLVLVLKQRRRLPWRWLILAALAVGVAFLPQVIFDVRHQGVLSSAVYRFLVTDNSFKLGFWQTVQVRLPFYAQVFFSKIYPVQNSWWWLGGLALIWGLIQSWKKMDQRLQLLLILALSPLVGMLFFQGNYGNVYDYYFTGYYLIFLLIAALLWNRLAQTALGKWVLVSLLTVFLWQNLPLDIGYLVSGVDGPETIALANQLGAIDWIYTDMAKQKFNVDVYVPPVIPHAYDYLFLWLGTNKYDQLPEVDQVPLLYTLYEVDPPHPERLEAWLSRQAGIGQIESEAVFGGITVQRRHRIQ